jgi:hypothetical protein
MKEAPVTLRSHGPSGLDLVRDRPTRLSQRAKPRCKGAPGEFPHIPDDSPSGRSTGGHHARLCLGAIVDGQGADQVTIRNVAKAAGISPGRVQFYFPTKDALLSAAFAAINDLGTENVRRSSSPSPAASGGWSSSAPTCRKRHGER